MKAELQSTQDLHLIKSLKIRKRKKHNLLVHKLNKEHYKLSEGKITRVQYRANLKKISR